MSKDFNWDDIKKPEDILNYGKKKFSGLKNAPNKSMLGWLIVIFVVFILVQTRPLFQVKADEVGVVVRFGKYVRTVNPGLNLKWPFGIERVRMVKNIRKDFTEEFGYRTLKADIRTTYDSKNYLDESLMLTGDLNAVEVNWVVFFNIIDPRAFLFNLAESSEFNQNLRRNQRASHATVRDMSQAVMRQVIGDYSVTEVITDKKDEIMQKVKEKLQIVLDSYQSGILISQVELKTVQAPGRVQAAFDAVNQAEQEMKRVILEANAKRNEIIPLAEGQAKKKILEAEGYSKTRVNEAHGDVATFLLQLEEYKKSEDITKIRLYLETMSRVLSNVDQKYIVDSDAPNILPMLPLGGTVE